MALNRDLREFIESLNANDVRYLVVGGYAVAFHGHPRYTKDLDVWIDATPANAKRMVTAIEHFGFGSLNLTEEDFLKIGQVVQIGQPPNRIDLITQCSGVEFATCYPLRATVEVEATPIDFIDLGNLRKNKLASGRHQDLADLENLK